MSLTLEELSSGAGRAGHMEPLFKGDGGGSLDDVLTAVWVGLTARGEARCPVCAGALARAAANEPAECSDCGASLE